MLSPMAVLEGEADKAKASCQGRSCRWAPSADQFFVVHNAEVFVGSCNLGSTGVIAESAVWPDATMQPAVLQILGSLN